MKQWLITGANRVDGKPMRIVVRAQTERGAQDQAYELNMLIETLEDMSTLETPRARQVATTHQPTPPAVDKPHRPQLESKQHEVNRDEPVLYESVHSPPPKVNESRVAFLALEKPFSKQRRLEKRREYRERGVNSVSEIAYGVFWGLFLFTLALPLVALAFFAFWMLIGKGLRELI